MSFTASTRVRIAILSVISLLFMQVSVAAYACAAWVKDAVAMQSDPITHEPIEDEAQDTTADASDESEEGCAGMDAAQALLCHAHCHGQTVSADVTFPPPLALPAIDVLSTGDFEQSLRISTAPDEPAPPLLLARLLAPPDRILHCCLLN